MKKKYNRPLTPNEHVKLATKRREELYRGHARDLCSAEGVAPEEFGVAPYLHRGHFENNLEATVWWLKQHVSTAGILVDHLDMEDCTRAFRSELHNKIPTNYWGDSA
jgi:hypothetical protein